MHVYLRKANLLNGSSILFDKDFYILTGPNNSGKTKFLTEAYQSLAGHMVSQAKIISNSELLKVGTHEELIARLSKKGVRTADGWAFRNFTAGGNFEGISAMSGVSSLERVLANQLSTAHRLILTNAPDSIDYQYQPKTHPLHYVYRDNGKRQILSNYFRRAFGTEIAIDMLGGKVIPIHIGQDAEPHANENVLDEYYLDRLRSLPRLEEQGDGMKSFVGIILNIIFEEFDMVFLDEPEAFLHPPQARLLGNILGKERPENAQLFVATHSADFIRGVLESNGHSIRMSRITRSGNSTSVTELQKEDLESAWSDPVLRFSNIIEGLFHERVIICEADGDCRFYAAIADALRRNEDHQYIRDLMFAQAGGKGGIVKLVKTMRSLAVPTIVVVDFDVFRQVGQLNAIIESLGADPQEFSESIINIRDDINKLGVRPAVSEVKKEISALLSQLDDSADELPRPMEKRLRDAIKTPPGWVRAKTTGLGILDRKTRPIGEALLDAFKSFGLFVVPVGEIESFEVNQHAEKNEWVNCVLEAHRDDIGSTEALSAARKFVCGMIDSNMLLRTQNGGDQEATIKDVTSH